MFESQDALDAARREAHAAAVAKVRAVYAHDAASAALDADGGGAAADPSVEPTEFLTYEVGALDWTPYITVGSVSFYITERIHCVCARCVSQIVRVL